MKIKNSENLTFVSSTFGCFTNLEMNQGLRPPPQFKRKTTSSRSSQKSLFRLSGLSSTLARRVYKIRAILSHSF